MLEPVPCLNCFRPDHLFGKGASSALLLLLLLLLLRDYNQIPFCTVLPW
jgi:hypothetical protein